MLSFGLRVSTLSRLWSVTRKKRRALRTEKKDQERGGNEKENIGMEMKSEGEMGAKKRTS